MSCIVHSALIAYPLCFLSLLREGGSEKGGKRKEVREVRKGGREGVSEEGGSKGRSDREGVSDEGRKKGSDLGPT